MLVFGSAWFIFVLVISVLYLILPFIVISINNKLGRLINQNSTIISSITDIDNIKPENKPYKLGKEEGKTQISDTEPCPNCSRLTVVDGVCSNCGGK